MSRWKIYLCAAVLPLVFANPKTTANTPAVPEAPPEVIQAVPHTAIKAEVTMYSGIESCHYEGCPMASGRRAYVGAVACPRKYPLGTKVEIGGNAYVCEDRTALRYDGRFDIFAGFGREDYQRALRWGIKTLEIKVF